jgi:hypothetical protein
LDSKRRVVMALRGVSLASLTVVIISTEAKLGAAATDCEQATGRGGTASRYWSQSACETARARRESLFGKLALRDLTYRHSRSGMVRLHVEPATRVAL